MPAVAAAVNVLQGPPERAEPAAAVTAAQMLTVAQGLQIAAAAAAGPELAAAA
jgi:hypothetical protein